MADVTIATLNIFNNVHGRWAEREPVIAEQLAALAPDACAFQEVDRFGERAAAVVNRVNRELGEERYTMHLMPNPSETSIKSLAVATHLPVVSRDGIDLDANDIALRLELGLDNATSATSATFDLVTTHFLYRPSREGGEIRQRQAAQLLEWMAARSLPALVVGDFNAVPTGATVAALKQRLRSAHEVAHGGEPETTHPTPFVYSLDAPKAFGVPELPAGRQESIDYIFVSEHWQVLDARLAFDRPARHDDTLYPSDHYGLVATLRRPT